MTEQDKHIAYTLNTANAAQIRAHLLACSPNFDPPLHEKVDIAEYAQKIESRAARFEAWHDDVLVGLVAAYFNDPEKKTGFITNVSTLANYSGKGIAYQLMQACIQYGEQHRFNTILLEVNALSRGAIRLYQKFDFVVSGEQHAMLKMKRMLLP